MFLKEYNDLSCIKLWTITAEQTGINQKYIIITMAKKNIAVPVYPEVPPHVEYTLTELGYSLKPVLDAMWDWGAKYKKQNS